MATIKPLTPQEEILCLKEVTLRLAGIVEVQEKRIAALEAANIRFVRAYLAPDGGNLTSVPPDPAA